MAMVIADPEQIRNFAQQLSAYLDSIDQKTNELNSAFSSLSESWKDKQRDSFEEVYDQLQQALRKFEENVKEQIPHLNQMAEDLETYKNR